MKKHSILLVPMVTLALVGCGGGSGGPGGPGGTSFTNFSSMKAPGTTTIKGVGKDVGYSVDADGVVTVMPYSDTGAVSADITLDSVGDITKVAMDAGGTKKTWDASNSTFSEVGPLLRAESNNGQDAVVIAGPEGSGFEYQTFGAWQTGYGTANGKAGAFSVGAETEGKNIPPIMTATFKGTAGGSYLDADGESDIMLSDATLNADFANRTVDFATTNTELLDSGARDDLNMTGSMSYSAGTNAMSGTVTTTGGMTGDIEGRFYGPVGQEVGGVFALTGAGNERLGGSFGAKR